MESVLFAKQNVMLTPLYNMNCKIMRKRQWCVEKGREDSVLAHGVTALHLALSAHTHIHTHTYTHMHQRIKDKI
jgi:hypothetical protein